MVAICASVLLGCAGYYWLTQWCSEGTLKAATKVWSLVAGILAGGLCATQWQPGRWICVAMVCLTPLLVALVAVDAAEHRLPDRMTGALAFMTAFGLGMADLAQSSELSLRRAALGAVVLGFGYLVLAFMGGGTGMGLGDVKLAPSLGALTAWFGWNTWALGAVLAFLLGGLWGLVLLFRGRGLKARMPFGPFMVAGAVIALIAA